MTNVLGWTEETLADVASLRGWSEAVIVRFGLTWDAAGGRVSIPVRDSVGDKRDELRYDPTGGREPKMIASAGSSRELFPARR